MLVSVVIPCYNHGLYLEETVQSVLNSSYEKIEIIIVDDGSEDNSKEIAKTLCSKYGNVSYYYQDNGGPSVARNYGISQSSGEYILPLDADDLISERYIQEAVNKLNEDPEVKVVYAKAEKFGKVNKPWKLKTFSLFNLALDNLIYVSAIFRKSDWERVNGYTENKVLVREDWEFWIKVLKDGGKVIQLPFVGFYYRIHTTSRRKSMSKEKKNAEIDYLNQHHSEYFKKYLNGPLRKNRSLSKLINLFS
jgi:glycosyltransferase involved in cell wall biosynthesis